MADRTFKEIINLLIQANDDLIADKISIDKARAICQNTQVLINAAKLQFEVNKFQNDNTNSFFADSLKENKLLKEVQPLDKNGETEPSCDICLSKKFCKDNGDKCAPLDNYKYFKLKVKL